ncbi:MAG: chlorite dismutase family protein [Anaerolineales bacterium]
MPEETPRTLNHFAVLAFKEAYWTLSAEARAAFHRNWLAGLRAAAQNVDIYQPTESDADLIVWSALPAEDKTGTATFFECLAKANNPYRPFLQPVHSLWGYTRPSQYTKTRSPQELDPFAATRKAYLVIYPFVKTTDWYLMSREARQGMMNEHIRIGKQYEDIRQLLLYSFGVQDQEFVVVYETDDLQRFSDLVNDLRSTEGRRYTLRDTPLHSAVYHPAEETLALWL